MKEIAILSGKGGTGKTSVSAAFATLQPNMVVADCDVDASNLYLILQPENNQTEVYVSGYRAVIHEEKCINCGLCIDYCRFDALSFKNGRVTILDTSCDGCQLCSRICSLKAITMVPNDKSRWYLGTYRNGSMVHARLAPGEENSGKLVNVVRDEARKLAKKQENDLIIIDGPPGIGCPVISTITGVNQVLLVTEPSKSGLHDLIRMVDLTANFKIKTSVVINKWDLNFNLTQQIETWCTERNIPVIGRLPFDEQVVEAMLQCKSIVEWKPESPISIEIQNIWKILNS